MRGAIAVDPGDKHVGVAYWKRESRLVYAIELDAEIAVEYTQALLEGMQADGREPVLIVEEFRLYPGLAKSQAYSPMETAQMIGALKWVAGLLEVEVVEQGASIKKPTRGQLRARGINQAGRGDHARDAELHLLYWLLKGGLVT